MLDHHRLYLGHHDLGNGIDDAMLGRSFYGGRRRQQHPLLESGCCSVDAMSCGAIVARLSSLPGGTNVMFSGY